VAQVFRNGLGVDLLKDKPEKPSLTWKAMGRLKGFAWKQVSVDVMSKTLLL
jgi:hypothetical protein